MDAIELGVLEWFGHLITDLEHVSLGVEAGDIQVESSFMKKLLRKTTPDAIFITRHYLQSLHMRRAALEAHDLSWYVAATYGLCHNWRKVLDSIPWSEWGGGMFEDRGAMALTVMVAGMGKLTAGKALEIARSFSPGKEEEVVEKASKRGLVVLDDGTLTLGPNAPRPRPRRH